MIAPGKTIGVLGGGQLGRMFAHAAQSLGYRVHVYAPSGPTPAGAAADREFNAAYEDAAALGEFGRSVDVATYEFENVPAESVELLGRLTTLRPSAAVLATCQNRQREKAWLKAEGFPHARYAEALDGNIRAAVAEVGFPCVVKTADFGYDGKGQVRLAGPAELERAVPLFHHHRCVVERWIEFERELSVICARAPSGEIRSYPVAENIHLRHILDTTLVPARISAETAARATSLAEAIAERLALIGLVAVEMFQTRAGEILVNELAPRPHNSGHWSIDAGETSQFEQHVRAICGLPLGPARARSPAVMCNILGDAWKNPSEPPNWNAILAEPRAKLHLYGKSEPRPGRKMGHFTVSGPDLAGCLELARSVRSKL